jgi:hypothetical protein
MRKILLLLIIFSLYSTTLWASDPIIGTWKLESTGDPRLKESTDIYREVEGEMIEYSSAQIYKDGSSHPINTIWPKEGGVVKNLLGEFPAGRLYVEVKVDPGNWYVFIMRNGRQHVMYHKIVSEDGKTLTMTLKANGSNGEVEVEGKSVYKKVEN